MWILTPEGIASGIVCARCALRAIAILVPPPTTVAPLCGSCRKERAAVCATCAGRLGAHVCELARANVSLRARRRFEEDPR